MRYTNRCNLPQEVVNVLSKDRYVKGEGTDYSVTTLKMPPRIVQLQRRHWDDIEEDCIDNLWSMFGSMAHNMLEEHGSDDSSTEERLYTTILDRVISGQIDHYKDGIITDYKVTSAWTLVYGSRIKEWEDQLNMYAQLCRLNGLSVRQIRIVAILRDWDKNKAKQDSKYPQAPIEIIPITLWEADEAEEYMEDRVEVQIGAEGCSDNTLPLCTAEEMWEQPSKYAVMKSGAKRATRVLDTIEEALQLAADVNGEVVIRPGKRTRCEEYCSVNCFCNQYKEYCEQKES